MSQDDSDETNDSDDDCGYVQTADVGEIVTEDTEFMLTLDNDENDGGEDG